MKSLRNAGIAVLIGFGFFAATHFSFQKTSEVTIPPVPVSGSTAKGEKQAEREKLPPVREELPPVQHQQSASGVEIGAPSSSPEAGSLAQFTPPTGLPANAASLEQMIATFQQERIKSAKDALRSPFGQDQ